MRAAMDAAPCAIFIGDWADEILGRPAFPFRRAKTELDLVVITVAQLGFGEQGAALGHIHARAIAFGLELCPAEVGPILRLAISTNRPANFSTSQCYPWRSTAANWLTSASGTVEPGSY